MTLSSFLGRISAVENNWLNIKYIDLKYGVTVLALERSLKLSELRFSTVPYVQIDKVANRVQGFWATKSIIYDLKQNC